MTARAPVPAQRESTRFTAPPVEAGPGCAAVEPALTYLCVLIVRATAEALIDWVDAEVGSRDHITVHDVVDAYLLGCSDPLSQLVLRSGLHRLGPGCWEAVIGDVVCDRFQALVQSVAGGRRDPGLTAVVMQALHELAFAVADSPVREQGLAEARALARHLADGIADASTGGL